MVDIDYSTGGNLLETDWSIIDGDLSSDNGLLSAVYVSLFTWRRARIDDRLPDDIGDRKGWWGYQFTETFGSRLWLLRREVITPTLLARIDEYAHEALDWLIDLEVAQKVAIQVIRLDTYNVGLGIEIFRTDGRRTATSYNNLWEQLER